MNKQIEEMVKYVPRNITAYDGNPRGLQLYIEQRINIAEALYNAGYRRQDEVAIEIFTQLEEEIEAAIKSNYRLYTKYLNEQDSQTVLRYGGKIDALRGIYCFIEELKKKYGVTEDESES